MFEENKDKSIREDYHEIIFEPITHSYLVGGKVLPSVSEIMKPLSTEYYKDIPEAIMNGAASRGKRVHEAIEIYDLFGVENESKEIKPYLLAYKMARQLERFTPIVNEKMLTNGEYCGTLDIIATLGDELVIVDLKATSQINFDLLEVQLAAYRELSIANGFEINKTFVCHLKPNSYKFVEIIPNDYLWQQLKNEWIVNVGKYR